MDRRMYPRYTVQVPVHFSGGEIVGEGRLRDISVGGCMVEAEAEIQAGRYLQLRFDLPGHEKPTEINLAAVRWARGPMFGLEFLYMNPENHERLLGFAPTGQSQIES